MKIYQFIAMKMLLTCDQTLLLCCTSYNANTWWKMGEMTFEQYDPKKKPRDPLIFLYA